jgi:hypothetical protein
MKRAFVIASITAVVLAIPLRVAAHHGSAAFDSGKRVTLKGTVATWVYSNPHCLLSLDVTGEDGQVVRWIAEGQAPNVIFPAGYRKDSFKGGDQVTITVEPVKNGRPLGRILQVVLADGTKLGAASSAPANTSAPPSQ